MLGAHENKHVLVVMRGPPPPPPSTPGQLPRANVGDRGEETHLRTINPTIKRTRTTKNWRIIAAQYTVTRIWEAKGTVPLFIVLYMGKMSMCPRPMCPQMFFSWIMRSLYHYLLYVTSSSGRNVFWMICHSVLHPNMVEKIHPIMFGRS